MQNEINHRDKLKKDLYGTKKQKSILTSIELSLDNILELENLFVNEINKTNSNIESLKKQIEGYKYKILNLKNN